MVAPDARLHSGLLFYRLRINAVHWRVVGDADWRKGEESQLQCHLGLTLSLPETSLYNLSFFVQPSVAVGLVLNAVGCLLCPLFARTGSAGPVLLSVMRVVQGFGQASVLC